eukprot:7036932-Prymnesium_polylepis.1
MSNVTTLSPRATGSLSPRATGSAAPSAAPEFASVSQMMESFLTLTCVSRFTGNAKELENAKRELAAREDRINELQEAVRERELARVELVREHKQLAQQLSEARELMSQLNAAKEAREDAERHAQSALDGPTGAQQLLAQELAELQEAEERAGAARDARKKAALARKEAVEAEL